MATEITQIKNARLQEIAKRADKNNDGKLKKNEYSLFVKEAQAQGVDYKEINEALDMNGLQRWWNDIDKVCKDGKDDGHLSFGESAVAYAKGLGGGLVKGIVKNPVQSLVGFAAITGLTILTGGAILPALAVAGVAIGAGTIAVGAVQNAKAENDGDAKRGLETAGTGTAVAALSMLGIKAANKEGAKAGVKGLQGLEKDNVFTNLGQAVKTLPEQMKVSGLNTKGNVLTWTSAIKGDKVIYANSNKMRAFGPQQEYMSKANDVQAYRFNPNGTEEEILANNPGVFAKDGKYYIPNKWSPEEPYLIDMSKDQMIMLYGGDDMAVCDGGVFQSSYVNTAKFKENGALDYVNPAKQNYGEVLNVTKQAPGSFQVAPEGTQIMTLEGARTVKAGEVIAYDSQGNPYATPVANILKRNTGLSEEAMAELAKVDLAAVAKTPAGQAFIAQNPEFAEEFAMTIRKNAIDAASTLNVEPADQQAVAEFMQQKPEVIDRLASYKYPDGSRVFSDKDIASVFLNCKKTIVSNPEEMYNIIENPDFIADIPGWKAGPSGALWKWLYY